MAQHGNQIGLYLQKDLADRIDSLVAAHMDVFKSRNHFINCAIILKLKEMENVFCKSKRESKERHNGDAGQEKTIELKKDASGLVSEYRFN